MLRLDDDQIAALIAEHKPIPDGLCGASASLRMSERNGHWTKTFEIESNKENKFVIKIRQLRENPLSFSVILGYRLPGLYTIFHLRRYNGKSHAHKNHIENEPRFYDFHIHTATERYQSRGCDPEHYAERTNRYFDLQSAIRCLIEDCGFRAGPTPLFPEH